MKKPYYLEFHTSEMWRVRKVLNNEYIKTPNGPDDSIDYTEKQQNLTLKNLEEGKLDIIIGTHKLLGKKTLSDIPPNVQIKKKHIT